MLDERIKRLLEEFAHLEKHVDDGGIDDEIWDYIYEAREVLDENENELLFSSLKYFLTNDDFSKSVKSSIINKDIFGLITVVTSSLTFYSEELRKVISKYWNNLEVFFNKLENILLVVKGKTKEEINNNSFIQLSKIKKGSRASNLKI